MLYRENVGIISRILLPSERLMWSTADMISNETEVFSSISSPWFSLLDDEWRLVFNQESTNLSLFVWKKNPKIGRYYVRLSILNKRTALEESVCSGELDSWGHFGLRNFEGDALGKEEWYTSGFMVFYCEIQKIAENPSPRKVSLRSRSSKMEPLVKKQRVEEKKNDVPIAKKGVDRLLQNLELLFQQGQDSDIVLKVENREFAMHKSILSIRSPVFASMFHQDMIEKKSSAVDIPDCTAEAFELFLRFMYTGSVSTISINNVFDLYYAADKYQVDDLKEDCVKFMKQNLSIDTFCDIITLSSRHHESDLQEIATCFFCSNIKNIVKTAKWKRYIQDYPLEGNELYVKAIQA